MKPMLLAFFQIYITNIHMCYFHDSKDLDI